MRAAATTHRALSTSLASIDQKFTWPYFITMTVYASRVHIDGYRGFAGRETLELGVPNGAPGSGLTVIVGPNSGGKSSVLEALQLCCDQSATVRLSRGKRNAKRDCVAIRVEYTDNSYFEITNKQSRSSQTQQEGHRSIASILVVPSRRSFPFQFGDSRFSREEYAADLARQPKRTGQLPNFAARLFKAQESDYAQRFNKMLGRILSPIPRWTIELEDGGQYVIEIRAASGTHNSEGAGDGVLSALIVTDALYDSEPPQITAIDEPELSLHPYLQRRVMRLLVEESTHKQIIVSTHSPYFVDIAALANGGRLARVSTDGESSRIRMLSTAALSSIHRIATDVNFPHFFGLDAKSVFFLDDNVVLVEGQEDVVFYRERVLKDLSVDLDGELFGWGVGGKSNMPHVASVLRDLGFRRVCGILDADGEATRKELEETYPSYKFVCIPANDVRTKPARAAIQTKEGLLDESDRVVRPEFRDAALKVFSSLNDYLKT